MRIITNTLLWAAMLCTTACSYTNHFVDEEEQDPDAPFNVMSDLDATAYDCWTYVNLETGETEILPDTSEWYYAGTETYLPAREPETPSIDWHIAVHRYDINTNGAEVIDTGIENIEDVTTLPDGNYTPNVNVNYFEQLQVTEGTQYLLVMDMSQMMDGNIGYAVNGLINRTLSGAVIRTETGSMPPTIYSPSENVFALKFADGSWAAIKLTKTYGGSDGARSGMMSFQYKFHKQ